MTLIDNSGPGYLHNIVEDYYQYNPDTLMPLFMLALAAQNRLAVKPSAGTEETTFASIDIKEVMGYDWVKLNYCLKNKLKSFLAEGNTKISVVGDIPDELKDIYETFNRYDNVTVVREYHHRKGILNHHSTNWPSENAQRQYAAIILAEHMISLPAVWLKKRFLPFENKLLEKSGIQPPRPRIRAAKAICALLKVETPGVVYNPFAGCGLAAAMIGTGNWLIVDGDANDKLLAIARLLCYGTGHTKVDIKERDSRKWYDGQKANYVMSTFLGYVDGKSAFDFCLGKCLEDFRNAGKFAGIAAPKDIFEKQSPEMLEALKRDWVDSIVLLPFGEVAVLVDAMKPAHRRKQVRFYNLTHPMLSHRPIEMILENEEYAEILRVSDVKRKGFLRNLVLPEIEKKKNCETITLGDILRKLPRKTWSLSRIPREDRVLAYIDRDLSYDQFQYPWMHRIKKKCISSLFSPAYKLDSDCLIVNSRGDLEPTLFCAGEGNAFFTGGFAFAAKVNEDIDYDWLVSELNEPYVQRQLHPYGQNKMVPETMTEDQILAVKLNRPIVQGEYDGIDEQDPDADRLKQGFQLTGDRTRYTVHRFLGHGYFGYTYSAESENLVTGERKEVVLKEFYPYAYFHREGVKAVLNESKDSDFINTNRPKFKDEADIMHRLGLVEDSHIVPAYGFFKSDETDTFYYTMPFYRKGSIQDLQASGFLFSEEMLINHVVIPMCKALHLAHRNRVLHLDIKPENILVDESGDAVLTDFGVAKQYDEEEHVINRLGSTSSSIFAPPELKTWGGMVKFGAQADIFGLAATLYYLATEYNEPHPIMDFSEQDKDIRETLADHDLSAKFADALVSGMMHSATSRPKDAQTFLNMFPGCEDIKL